METFDFDSRFRRMERASEEEFAAIQQEVYNYLHSGSVDDKYARTVAWKQALARLQQRSETELALMKDLMGTQEAV